ncbi:hypothetical protein [Amorphus sp. 3PC139-8]
MLIRVNPEKRVDLKGVRSIAGGWPEAYVITWAVFEPLGICRRLKVLEE